MLRTDAQIDAWIGRNTPGAAYVHFDRSRVIHERYAGVADVATQRPVDAQTSFHGFSVTKTMTALAVMQLVRAGRLDLDDPVRQHLPNMPYAENIRVRHLLTHTAGLPNPLPLSWVHAPDADFDRDAFFATVFAKHAKLRSKPGERCAYSNLGYVLLGQLIERSTGDRYEEVVDRMILRPSGIAADEIGSKHPSTSVHATGYLRSWSVLALVLPFLFDTRRHMGTRIGPWRPFHPFVLNGIAYGGSIGTATGYRKYLQALLTDGKLIDVAGRDQLFTEELTNHGKATGMAMSWFCGNLNGERYRAHPGGGGGYYAELRVYPDLGRGSVLLLNRTGVSNERLLDRLDQHLLPDQRHRTLDPSVEPRITT